MSSAVQSNNDNNNNKYLAHSIYCAPFGYNWLRISLPGGFYYSENIPYTICLKDFPIEQKFHTEGAYPGTNLDLYTQIKTSFESTQYEIDSPYVKIHATVKCRRPKCTLAQPSIYLLYYKHGFAVAGADSSGDNTVPFCSDTLKMLIGIQVTDCLGTISIHNEDACRRFHKF